MTPDLVVIGNLLVDDLVFADGSVRMAQPGGAVLYVSLAAALWGARVGCLSVAGSDYPAETLAALAARGVDVSGIRSLGRPGLRTWLLHEEHARRVVHQLGGPSHDDVSPALAELPAEWGAARAFHLAPMPLAHQLELARGLAGRPDRLIALDPYERLTSATESAWRKVIAFVHAFLPSEDDLELPEAEGEPHEALRSVAGGRLRWVAFKRGRRGGVLYEIASGRFIPWSARITRVVDPTGAGDAFGAGLLTALLDGLDLESALRRAVVSASFAVEDWGAAGLLAATRDAAEQRLAAWFGNAAVA